MNKEVISLGLAHIARHDRDMANMIRVTPAPIFEPRLSGFEALLNIITSQQISTAAANAIWSRLKQLVCPISPQHLVQFSPESLHQIGLSRRKAQNSLALAQQIISGTFAPDALSQRSDAEVVKEITQLVGFGRWSAEIYLLFSLQRQDILPADDLAILIALQKIKGYEKRPSPSMARNLSKTWAPYRSVGALFLWRFYQQHISRKTGS